MDDDDLIELPDEEPDANPFAAPRAEVRRGRQFDDEDEYIRRQYLNHEASLKSVGYLYVLGAALLLFSMFLPIKEMLGKAPGVNPDKQVVLTAVVLGFVYLGVALLNLALAYGLIRLQNWARWTTFGLTIFNLVLIVGIRIFVTATTGKPGIPLPVLVIVLIIQGYIIYLTVSPKAEVVCSQEYKEIIARTPHIRYKTSIAVWILLGLICLVLALGVVGMMLNRRG